MSVVLTRIAAVYVVNGEGGRERVEQNAIEEMQFRLRMGNQPIGIGDFEAAKKCDPAVLLQLCNDRKSHHEPRPEIGIRAEFPIFSWEEVEALKAVPGVWNEEFKRWEHPLTGKVRITIETIDE